MGARSPTAAVLGRIWPATQRAKHGEPQVDGIGAGRAASRFIGYILKYDRAKGFGFIGSEEVSEGDVYFKRSELPQEFRSHPRVQIIGMRVEFAYYLVAQGWARAENLKPVDAATEGGHGDGAGAWGGDAV